MILGVYPKIPQFSEIPEIPQIRGTHSEQVPLCTYGEYTVRALEQAHVPLRTCQNPIPLKSGVSGYTPNLGVSGNTPILAVLANIAQYRPI